MRAGENKKKWCENKISFLMADGENKKVNSNIFSWDQ